MKGGQQLKKKGSNNKAAPLIKYKDGLSAGGGCDKLAGLKSIFMGMLLHNLLCTATLLQFSLILLEIHKDLIEREASTIVLSGLGVLLSSLKLLLKFRASCFDNGSLALSSSSSSSKQRFSSPPLCCVHHLFFPLCCFPCNDTTWLWSQLVTMMTIGDNDDSWWQRYPATFLCCSPYCPPSSGERTQEARDPGSLGQPPPMTMMMTDVSE